MKRKNLVLLAGIPASGKSTWLKNHLGEGDAYVSRDEVRFSLLSDDEDYFSHETEVFDKFVASIEEKMNQGYRVFADATHINWPSRRKLIERLHNKEEIDIDVYVFKTDFSLCLERNERREGRAYVPKSVLRRMRAQMTHPLGDPFEYHSIVEIKEDE